MQLNVTGKIHATYLRMNGIEKESIDVLHGRVIKEVFVVNYYKPDFTEMRKKILSLVHKLTNEVLEGRFLLQRRIR